MKRFMLMISLLVAASVGAVYAQSQDTVTLDPPEAVATDNFISIGPIGDKPILLAEALKPTPPDNDPTTKPGEKPNSEKVDPKNPKGKKPQVNFGLMLGVFSPVNQEVRDLFGSSWLRIGIRPIPRDLPEKYRITFDTSYYAMERQFVDQHGKFVFKDEVQLIPFTVGVLHGLNQGKNTRGYIALNVGPYYGSLKAPSVGLKEQKWGLNANISTGIVFNDKFSIEGRYEYMQKLAGLDFSAFTISASYRIFSARL